MRGKMILRLSLLVIFSVSCACSTALAQGPNSSSINFMVSMPKPWTHLLEVEMQIQVPANLNVPNETNLIMPVWTPGSYMIREFDEHVQDFDAGADGRPLTWLKFKKNTWSMKVCAA